MHVMRFWLDAGVDGMRLDAVPYLCEREGTNSENLPETHAVIKRMRAELDKHYRDRMFLAEANQWPEDVREYFGDGDECHMAFHFPLMPRMYMAIAQEDRHPIVEIMEQTPDIPDNCQWAVFLRNHDELTLEMVTDRERDYLYQTYAIDPQARLNLGIRRRLAPLLDNDRHRIELMNLLLMTMPGSPILYYGDEIGMGDNILLGDRNGVRTPMQWRGGANGGFSTADPARLYLPPIVDPVYGFGAVNVESQQRNASSLLNWTRRLIAMRKAHRAFGRGTLRFLRPGNRKILAYLREYEGEMILCVANLSRAPQAVELDLSAYKGTGAGRVDGAQRLSAHRRVAVSAHPERARLLCLSSGRRRGGAGLARGAPGAARSAGAGAGRYRLAHPRWQARKTVRGEPADGARAREQLERQIIPRYFRSQPWFANRAAGGKIRVRRDANGPLTPATGCWPRHPLPWRVARCIATPCRWRWPGRTKDESRMTALLHATLAKVRRRARVGVLFDAFWDDAFCCAVVSAMECGETLGFGGGQVRFQRDPRLSRRRLCRNAANVREPYPSAGGCG